MFDVLMQIYETSGYTKREAVSSIIENNLYGIDIDERAAQLAYFAVMMKGCQYDRRFLTRGVQPRVYAIEESNNINRAQLDCLGNDLSNIEKNAAKMQLNELLDTLTDAKEYGSILTVDNYDWDLLRRYAESSDADGQMSIAYIGIEQTTEQLKKLIDIGEAMVQKYDAVVTNPPYMGASGMGAGLSKYVKEKYPDSKSDLFAVFIERCEKFTGNNRYQAMITQHAWMFLSSFEKLRTKLLSLNDISTMVHLGARAFEEIGGEVVQTTSFVLNNRTIKNYKGKYCRLIDPVTQYGKEKIFLEKENRYTSEQTNFSKIPGSPVAYWVSEKMLNAFENGILLGDIADSKQGLATTDNKRFLRIWSEIEHYKIIYNIDSIDAAIKSGGKWFPYNKGGEFRKWFGNNEYIVNYENDGKEIKSSVLKKYPYLKTPEFVVKNTNYYFKKCISWSLISSSVAAFRYKPLGFIFDVAGMSCFATEDKLLYLLALCNTKVVMKILEIIAPTMNFQCGDIANIPVFNSDKKEDINKTVEQNIKISRNDWDSYETSWDFKRNPLT